MLLLLHRGECIRLKNFVQNAKILGNTLEYCGQTNFPLPHGDPRHDKNGEGVYIGTSSEQVGRGRRRDRACASVKWTSTSFYSKLALGRAIVQLPPRAQWSRLYPPNLQLGNIIAPFYGTIFFYGGAEAHRGRHGRLDRRPCGRVHCEPRIHQ